MKKIFEKARHNLLQVICRKLHLPFLTLLFVVASCNEHDTIKPKNNTDLKRIQSTSIDQESQLVPVLNKIGFFQSGKTQFSNAKGSSAGLQIDVNQILKVLQGDGASHVYTFKIDEHDFNPKSFSNLIIEELNEGYLGYILQYNSDAMPSDFSTFTGTLKRYDLNNSLLSEKRILNGQLDKNVTSNGRVAQTIYCVAEINTFFECVEYGKKFDSNSQTYTFGCLRTQQVIEIVLEPCEDGGGGGAGGAGSGGDTGGTYIPPLTGGSGSEIPSGGGSPSGSGTTIGVVSNDLAISEQLSEYLLSNPFALVGVPCKQLPKWQAVAQHVPPQSVIDKLNNLDENYTSILSGDWDIQHIEDASSPIVNLDYFEVAITKLPKNPATGVEFSADGFFSYVRKNLSNFLNTDNVEFGPYNSAEAAIWNSDNYLGAIMRFEINVGGSLSQDGSVICSYQNGNSWRFTTIESPQDWNHPVSGTREFGLIVNPDGTYKFYTRGVDRVAESFDDFIGNLPFTQSAFEGADALWSQFQANLEAFINSPANGGLSQKIAPTTWRPDWVKIKDVLEGKRPISDLGCK